MDEAPVPRSRTIIGLDGPARPAPLWAGEGAPRKPRVAVCGAHLAGFPLHHQLGHQARLIAATTTAPEYRLFALDGRRPALVRARAGRGVAIDVEVYELSGPDALWWLLHSVPAPLGLGPVTLADGTTEVGFICAHGGVDEGAHRDISEFGGWRGFKAMTDDEYMCERTALEAVDLLKARRVTPERLIEVVRNRIDRVNPAVNAVVTTCFDRALEKLKELRAAMARTEAPPPAGFLHGLPVLIKDTNYVKGVRFSLGFYTEEEDAAHVAKAGLTDSCPLVLQIERMGGLVVGKTNLSEFAAGGHSFNSIFAMCVNPRDTRMSAGGSSGGAGAALAANICWLAQGSDRGGSVRLPASFNGVVGFRTSPGVVMQAKACNPHPGGLHSMNGPMARTVLDCALFLDAMCPPAAPGPATAAPPRLPGWEAYRGGPAPRPGTSWLAAALAGREDAVKLLGGLGTDGSGGYRVAVSRLGVSFTRPEVYDAVVRAAADLAGVGGEPTHVEEPFDISRVNGIYTIFRAANFIAAYGTMQDDSGSAGLTVAQKARLKPETKWNAQLAERLEAFGRGDDGGLLALRRAHEDAALLQEELEQFFDAYDCLCCPVSADVAFPASLRYPCQVRRRAHAIPPRPERRRRGR